MTLTTINLAALGDTINLSTEVTGTLPTGNGGTGSTATTFVNAATNVTGTLPSANLPTVPVTKGGTGLTSGTTDQILKFTGSTTLASAAEAAGGKVAQVVRAYGGAELMTSSTYNSTGLYATITPTAATSSLYVVASTPRIYNNGTQPLYAQIWHGTSGEGSGGAANGLYSAGAGYTTNTHSPATMTGYLAASSVTTDARTFTVMHKNSNNSTLVGWYEGLSGAQGELVIMEFLA